MHFVYPQSNKELQVVVQKIMSVQSRIELEIGNVGS